MDRALKLVIISRVSIFFFILIIVGIINFPSLFINENPLYNNYFNFLNFVNSILIILIIIGIITLISGILWYLKFPYKVFAPIGSTILTLFTIELMYRAFLFIEQTYINSGFEPNLRFFYIFIAVIALILSFIKLFSEMPDNFKEAFFKINTSKNKERFSKKLPKKNKKIKKAFQKKDFSSNGTNKSSNNSSSSYNKNYTKSEQFEKQDLKDKMGDFFSTALEKFAGGIITIVDSITGARKK